MKLTSRQRVQRRIELALGWDMLVAYQRNSCREAAKVVVDELLAASAEGKAVERFIRVLNDQEEAAS